MSVKKGGQRRSKRLQGQKDEEEHEELVARDLELSSSEDEDERTTSAAAAAVEVDDAILDYQTALEKRAGLHAEASDDDDDDDDDDDEFYNEDDEEDSSDEERPQRNTIGEVPLEWYSDEEHIGYDTEGHKLVKKGKKDKLDELLDKNDSSLAWRTVYDKYNDEEIVLSKEEIRMIQNIRAGRFAHSDVNPYPDENDWFSRHREVMPLSAAPEPKSRFTPSKWEEKKVVKLVRAIRKGWLTTKAPPKKPDVYLLWDQESDELNKTLAGLTYLAAPKMKLPGHDESYNPPKEYLMTEEEKNTAELEAEEADAPPPFIPHAFDALRKVPAYERYINERFERCLDLYLCPRSRIKRMDISDPESLVPKLPKPKELQPFPTILSIKYLGHSSKVTSISVHPSGQWLMSGSKDASVRVWEVSTGRCMCTWTFESPVHRVAWCPKASLTIISVVSEKKLFLIPVKLNTFYEASVEILQAAIQAGQETTDEDKAMPASWSWTDVESKGSKVQSVAIDHSFEVRDIAWHNGGDYFCTTCPKGNTKAVLVHQLSKGVTQNPFKKNRGIVTRALFHPTKPFFFVATQQAVRIYNLAKQSLAKKLVSGSGVITSMSIHSSGDHVILGGEDKRVCWYDLDLSSKPYKALRYHDLGVRAVSFHPSYPLFASGSDDGTTHVFHGRVFADLMTNPMIVPVKILRGHKRVNAEGVTDVVFHPKQPWAFTAGADGAIYLHVNP